MQVYITEVTITDHPDYQVLFGVPTSSHMEAVLAVELALREEMADMGEEQDIIISEINEKHVKLTYEGALNSYYITVHEVSPS